MRHLLGVFEFCVFGCGAGFTVTRHQMDSPKFSASLIPLQKSTEVRNWDVVAKALEAAGATSSQMYIRAKALAEGKLDPMPTSFPEAPYSISAVAG